MGWKWVQIDDYHLRPDDLKAFLRSKFGNYDFGIRRGNDLYTFLAPRDLTEAEVDYLDSKRWRN